MNKLSTRQKLLRKELLRALYLHRLSHIGSCLSVLDIIDSVFKVKGQDEKFVLSNGHAGFALYTVLKNKGLLTQKDFDRQNVHPDRNPSLGIDLSTGSLGQGLPIAVGLALANPKKRVFCLISDGECTEGSIWEALRLVSDQKITNLYIILSANKWGAYDPINIQRLKKRILGFGFKTISVDGKNQKEIERNLKIRPTQPHLIFAKTDSEQFPFLKQIDAHYYVMKEEDYLLAQKILK